MHLGDHRPVSRATKPPKGSDKGQIKNKVRASDKKLTLENKNNTYPYTLHYALRFTGKTYEVEGKQFGPNYAYDPEYRNNGGGGNV